MEVGARTVASEGFIGTTLKILHLERTSESAISDHIFYLLKKAMEHKSISEYFATKTTAPSSLLEYARSSEEGYRRQKCVTVLEQIGVRMKPVCVELNYPEPTV